MPEEVRKAMQKQIEAERDKRARVLESEGIIEAAINRAEGERQSAILASLAAKEKLINEIALVFFCTKL